MADNKRRHTALLIMAICMVSVFLFGSVSAVDLSTEKTLYTVATAHLDTQWNWTIKDTINNYIPKTLDNNFTLFTKYPDYKFSFEGAFRYQLAKEYYPAKYETLKQYIQQGRWNVAGSSWDAGDVNVPSPESLIRQILYGNGFFKNEFGVTSKDIFLPDCFGFGYALPSVAAHCGLKGFSTQKLTWGSAYGIPFDIGRWVGPDGSSIVAALNPGDYTSSVSSDLSNDQTWLNRINDNGSKYGVYAGYKYYGTGDTGGSPSDSSVNWIQQSVNGSGPINVLSTAADQMYRDITPSQAAGLPQYRGELLMTTHGTGSYTSKNISKRWNRKNELLADAAERANVIAAWLGGTSYPQQRLTEAWQRFLWHQFHDDLTGTSIPQAYNYSWNEYVLSLNQFAGELTNGVGAVSLGLNTQVNGVPMVVFNPLAQNRQDIVEARVYFAGGAPTAVRVWDGAGAEVPSQMGAIEGNFVKVIFLADMPALGFKVYDIRTATTPCTIATGLTISNNALENGRYRVTIDSNGDISSIYDKTNGKELLSQPLRLEMLADNSNSWPAWEVLYNDVNATPREYVRGPVTVSVIENGPARVTLEVTRQTAGSTFKQRLKLAAGTAGDRLEVENDVDWQTKKTLLKASFPLNVSNSKATYDLGLGTIDRPNNTSSLYEVPAQQWADLTDSAGGYGVSILNDCKYGWDKPANNKLRLTLIHTPSGTNNSQDQQDIGKNQFTYAIYGHTGSWSSAPTPWQAARLNQPLLAFQTASHNGSLGSCYSFINVNTGQVGIKAIKKAEAGNEIILRVQELTGSPANNVTINLGSGITSAREVNGFEETVSTATVNNGALVFNCGAYQPKTFALTLATPPINLARPATQTVALTFNKDVVTTDNNRSDGSFDTSGNSIPAELLPVTVTAEAIPFQIGPTGDGSLNALVCNGQSIQLSAGGYNRLYLLAASSGGDLTDTFKIDNTQVSLTIQDYKAPVGIWDNAPLGTRAAIKRDPVAWIGTHRHTPGGNSAYDFCYLFKYRIDLPQGVTNPTLTLPMNSKIIILALTLAANNNDDTSPAGYLYDYAQPPAPLSPNLALSKTATANQNVSGEDPFKAVDGIVDSNSKWCSNVSGDKWLKLDLGQAYDINRWIVRHAGAGGETTDWNTRDFKLQKSSDGNTWTDVDTVTGNTASVTDRIVQVLNARYIRLYITKPTQTSDVAARIYELELYSPTSGGGNGTGLKGEYFDNMDLTNLKVTRTDAVVNFDWGSGSPDPVLGADTFSIRWAGQVQPKYSESYTFYTTSDDGVRLWVNGQQIINNWTDHSPTDNSGTINLTAGQKYDLKMEFYENGGGAVAKLAWSSPSQTREIIPQSQLYPATGSVTPVQVDLSSYYNQDGFSYDTSRSDGAYDPGASPTSTYSADLLNSNPTYDGTTYTLGSKTNGTNNEIQGTGQTITLTPGIYSSIRFLSSATNGDQTSTFRLTYSDGTYSDIALTIKDWCTGNTSGQMVVQTMAHRHQGTADQNINTYVFAYYLTPSAGKTVTGVVIPNNTNIHILAISLVP